MGRYTSGGIGRDIIAGAVAGAAAVWLIDKMQLNLTHAAVTRDQPQGVDPAHAVAAKAAEKTGADLGPQHDNPLGHTVHYGVGAGLGALYGLLRGMAPAVSTGRGALYGLTAFLLADEIGTPALGLAKSPLHYPARDHARGALAHTLFGVFTDLGTRLVAPWRDEVVIYHGPSIGERIESGRQALAEQGDYLLDRGGEYADYVADRSGEYLDKGRRYARQGREYISDLADDARDRIEDIDVSGYAERGRKQARGLVDRVRSYLPDPDDVADLVDRGRRYATGLADAALSAVPNRDDVRSAARQGRKRAERVADDARARMPDRDDLQDLADEGRRRGRRAAQRVRDQAPDRDDAADLAERGRKRVQSLAEQAREQVEQGGSSLKRALHWLIG